MPAPKAEVQVILVRTLHPVQTAGFVVITIACIVTLGSMVSTMISTHKTSMSLHVVACLQDQTYGVIDSPADGCDPNLDYTSAPVKRLIDCAGSGPTSRVGLDCTW